MFLEQDSRLAVDGRLLPRCSNSIGTAAWSQRAFHKVLLNSHQTKTWPEFFVQRLGIIADNLDAATVRRALWAKGAEDHMPSGFHRAGDLA
jgi:hypothetical protein